jgi:Leucine-rich repeat (LRR) protein
MKVSDHDHELWYGDKKIAKEMTKEQLEKKFEFGLQYLNIGNSILSTNNFKQKELAKRKEPQWPVFLEMFAAAKFDTLNLAVCQLSKNDMELVSFGLHQNPFGRSQLRVLNLSRNNIMKEGAKTLAAALEGNDMLEALDLSQCKLGVSGAVSIAQALHKNSSLKHLNLYRNKLDVDGARALRELLKVNSTLEFLDVGYNRLREKGIKAITDGIVGNEAGSNVRHLGLRFNFINDDGFAYLFDNAIIPEGKSKISHVYAMQNYLSEHFTVSLGAKMEQLQRRVYVDSFEKLQYLGQERLDRCVWISPLLPPHVQIGTEAVWKFFQHDFECGLI